MPSQGVVVGNGSVCVQTHAHRGNAVVVCADFDNHRRDGVFARRHALQIGAHLFGVSHRVKCHDFSRGEIHFAHCEVMQFLPVGFALPEDFAVWHAGGKKVFYFFVLRQPCGGGVLWHEGFPLLLMEQRAVAAVAEEFL